MTNQTNTDALRQLMERLRGRTAIIAIDRSTEGRTKVHEPIYGFDPLCTQAADAIEAMVTELEALRASRGRMVEALTYYANDEHYDGGDVPCHIYVLDDHGRIARAAVQPAEDCGEVIGS